MKNPSAFFVKARAGLGEFTQGQVDGLNVLLAVAETRKTPLPYLAYILATAWWETGRTMQPVAEAFYLGSKADAYRKKLRYWPYYGRGYVQLTWEANYKKASTFIGVDFVKNPDLVMQPEYAAVILFEGMAKGWFTGKDLDDYIDLVDESDAADKAEDKNARRIVNGTDKDDEIAATAVIFEHALRDGGYGEDFSAEKPALLIIGDSIAVGLGGYLGGATTDAKVGIPSAEIVGKVKPAKWLVVSAGSNDSDPVNLAANLQEIALAASDNVIWVLPADAGNKQTAAARSVVAGIAKRFGDLTVDFVAGPDHVHPKSYRDLGEAVMKPIRAVSSEPVSTPPSAPVEPSPVDPAPSPSPASESFWAWLLVVLKKVFS